MDSILGALSIYYMAACLFALPVFGYLIVERLQRSGKRTLGDDVFPLYSEKASEDWAPYHAETGWLWRRKIDGAFEYKPMKDGEFIALKKRRKWL
jgi:hypothetical protein